MTKRSSAEDASPAARGAILAEKAKRYFVPTYRPDRMVVDHGEGSRLWDVEGNEFIDFGSGIGVCSLGHRDPEVVAALTEQAHRLWHVSNVYLTEPAILLAEELVRAAPFADRVFLCNSGAEANEAAIKLARKHASLHLATEKREIITFEGSFHGRTLATVAATAQPKVHHGFEPLPPGFLYCAFNDFAAVERCFSARTCAVLVEPVQGEGGVRPAAPGFLRHLAELCVRHQALLMLDEVQCGLGRTGRTFAYEWDDGVKPHVVTLAKALGGGIPIGAMLTAAEVAETLQFGSHGTTFGGNPVMAAAARVVLRRLRSPQLMANVARQGDRLRRHLQGLGAELSLFGDVRGRGLMLGAELAVAWRGRAGELMERCRQQGVLILQAGPDVLRFLPPLNISDEDMDEGLRRLGQAFGAAVGR